MKHFTLNRVFAAYGIAFVLVVGGFVPREVILPVAGALALWFLLAPLEEAALFFLRNVPLFVALPLTATFDNFNLWRPLAVILVLRLLWEKPMWQELISQWHALRQSPSAWIKKRSMTRRLIILGIIAALSLLVAAHPMVGIKRIIYFGNLLMAPIVLYALIRRGQLTTERVIRNIAIPTMIIIVVGYLQLFSTYLMDVYQFMRLWGEGIQLRQFGSEWSHIAVWVGNTWLAYYGPQLSLRVFSLFPDSHTFPMAVLLGIPALLAIAIQPVMAMARHGVKAMARTRASLNILWIPAAFLIAILSGTRGIWAASLGVVFLVFAWKYLMHTTTVDQDRKSVFSYLSVYLILFFMLFAVAWPIFISPQFLLGKGDWGLLGNRVRSIIDFGETSNALRLKIWKSSLISITHHPLLGVGIGNFPVVLDQNIALAKAGSTAHNVYLHVAAEMGVFAALEFIVLLGAILWGAWRWFRTASGVELVYAAANLLFIPWVLIYLLTDAALFDERAFLMFGFTAAIIWAHGHHS